MMPLPQAPITHIPISNANKFIGSTRLSQACCHSSSWGEQTLPHLSLRKLTQRSSVSWENKVRTTASSDSDKLCYTNDSRVGKCSENMSAVSTRLQAGCFYHHPKENRRQVTGQDDSKPRFHTTAMSDASTIQVQDGFYATSNTYLLAACPPPSNLSRCFLVASSLCQGCP